MTDTAALRDLLYQAKQYLSVSACSIELAKKIDAALSTPSAPTTAWDEARCRKVWFETFKKLDNRQRPIVDIVVAAMLAVASPAPKITGRTGENFREVGKTPRGYTIFVEDNEAGGHTYYSDEIGGGVMVWDTALIARESIEFAFNVETPAPRRSGVTEAIAEAKCFVSGVVEKAEYDSGREFKAGRELIAKLEAALAAGPRGAKT